MRYKIVNILFICIILCSGCSRQDVNQSTEQNKLTGEMNSQSVVADTTDSPGWVEDKEELVTLDWYVNFSWFTTRWGDNLVSKTITEETGVSVNFTTPMGNETEKLNALMASDSLPDLITLGWWEPQVNEMIQNQMVYPLNELADQYDLYFWKVADETALNWYTKEDGNIYCYPNSSIAPTDLEAHDNVGVNERFLVRKDIYEAIGSPDMSTKEGFVNAVKAAAEQFPTVDGNPLIPIGAHVFDNEGCVSFDKYLMDFLAVPWEKDGKYYDRYTDPDYISWLKVFRQLGEEGYLANDIFVDTRTQTEEKMAQGRYFCMIYQYADMIDQQKMLYEKNPDSIYVAVDGPTNEAGDLPTLPTNNINGWTVTLISKNCKNPKRAIQFMDYLMSERGQMITFLGVEGETYDFVDGEPVLKEEVKKLLDTDREQYNAIYGADNTYWMLQDLVMQLAWKQEPSQAVAQLDTWANPYAVYNGQYDVFLPMNSEAEIANDKISKLWSQTLPELLLAPTEEAFDKDLSTFIQKRDAMGFSMVMDEKTDYMKQAKEKLGLQ